MPEDLKNMDIQLDNTTEALALFGTEDRNLKQIEEQLKVTIITRGRKCVCPARLSM